MAARTIPMSAPIVKPSRASRQVVNAAVRRICPSDSLWLRWIGSTKCRGDAPQVRQLEVGGLHDVEGRLMLVADGGQTPGVPREPLEAFPDERQRQQEQTHREDRAQQSAGGAGPATDPRLEAAGGLLGEGVRRVAVVKGVLDAEGALLVVADGLIEGRFGRGAPRASRHVVVLHVAR